MGEFIFTIYLKNYYNLFSFKKTKRLGLQNIFLYKGLIKNILKLKKMLQRFLFQIFSAFSLPILAWMASLSTPIAAEIFHHNVFRIRLVGSNTKEAYHLGEEW